MIGTSTTTALGTEIHPTNAGTDRPAPMAFHQVRWARGEATAYPSVKRCHEAGLGRATIWKSRTLKGQAVRMQLSGGYSKVRGGMRGYGMKSDAKQATWIARQRRQVGGHDYAARCAACAESLRPLLFDLSRVPVRRGGLGAHQRRRGGLRWLHQAAARRRRGRGDMLENGDSVMQDNCVVQGGRVPMYGRGTC